MNTQKLLLNALVMVRDTESKPKYQGICDMVQEVFFQSMPNEVDERREAKRILRQLMTEWPEYSGSPTYPVGGATEYHESWDLWANPRRVKLLNWLIKELQK